MTVSLPAHPAAPRRVTVALAGRANCGKTSLASHLTGATQRPINFPGSSVERVESRTTVGEHDVVVVDLPGIASLSPASPDERLALAYVRGEAGAAPDVLLAVIDASKLAVDLHLLRELTRLGRPIVVALNKGDIARRAGLATDVAALGRAIGMPVVETDGRTGVGAASALAAAVAAATAAPPRGFDRPPADIAAEVQSAPAGALRRGITDRIDRLVLGRLTGLPILAGVMLLTFQLVYSVAQPFMDGIEAVQGVLAGAVARALPSGALESFLVDGLINGVGSVFIYLPQIVILIAFVTVLESSGYMARAAFLLDRLLCRVGLSGRSFVPLTSAFACAIPGILASRIIDDERDRIATIVVAPLMSCSARLPVYVLLIGAFFPTPWVAGLVLFGLYATGIAVAAGVAYALRRLVLRRGRSVLMMELPEYEWPSWRVVLRQTLAAARSFIVLAGTLILATSIVIWILTYYPRPIEIHHRFEAARAVSHDAAEAAAIDVAERAAYLEQSFLARAGKAVQPIFAPAGFDWRTTVGILAAFPARELIVPTLGILHSVGDVDPGEYELTSIARADHGLRARLRESMTPSVALALMVFFALCSQCAGTLAAIRRETRSWRWPAFTFSYMTALAWIGAVVVHAAARGLGLP